MSSTLNKYAQASLFVSVDLTYIYYWHLEANPSEASLMPRGAYTTRNDWEVIV